MVCFEKFVIILENIKYLRTWPKAWTGCCGCLWPLTSVCLQRTIQQFSQPAEETLWARQINYYFTQTFLSWLQPACQWCQSSLKNMDSFIFNWIFRIWVKLKLHLFCIIASPTKTKLYYSYIYLYLIIFYILKHIFLFQNIFCTVYHEIFFYKNYF